MELTGVKDKWLAGCSELFVNAVKNWWLTPLVLVGPTCSQSPVDAGWFGRG